MRGRHRLALRKRKAAAKNPAPSASPSITARKKLEKKEKKIQEKKKNRCIPHFYMRRETDGLQPRRQTMEEAKAADKPPVGEAGFVRSRPKVIGRGPQ